MKTYPTIGRNYQEDETVYAFDKLDGSNIRAEWSAKKGFWKYGRRHGLIDDTNPMLKEAPDLFIEKYSEDLDVRFRDLSRLQKAIVYFEFCGPNSFAGVHQEDDDHTITVFDVSLHQKGFMLPKTFLSFMRGLDTPSVLYKGIPTQDFKDKVMLGTLSGMTFEGVVCKSNRYEHPGLPVMFKLKNRAWIEKLRELCKGNEKQFQQML